MPRRPGRPTIPVLIGVGGLIAFVVVAAAIRSPDAGADPTTPSTVTAGSPAVSTVVSAARSEVTVLPISSVTCTTELESQPCSLLVDGDTTTAWNAPAGGVGAEITLTLEEAAQISRIVFRNHANDADLTRNARVARVIVHFGGSEEVVDVTLDGSHGPYRVPVPLVFTSSISIHIEGVHPAEAYQGLSAFEELALAEIDLIGFPSGG